MMILLRGLATSGLGCGARRFTKVMSQSKGTGGDLQRVVSGTDQYISGGKGLGKGECVR